MLPYVVDLQIILWKYWEEIRALKAKRLIALNKCPEIRPIGIGEVGDRFLSKTMTHVTGMM